MNDVQPDKKLTLGEYRRDMAEFTSVLMEEYYRFRSGLKAELNIAGIYNAYKRLFSPPLIRLNTQTIHILILFLCLKKF